MNIEKTVLDIGIVSFVLRITANTKSLKHTYADNHTHFINLKVSLVNWFV